MPCPELLGAPDTVQRPCSKEWVHTLRGTASLASETPGHGDVRIDLRRVLRSKSTGVLSWRR
jgi:hypothetical protein